MVRIEQLGPDRFPFAVAPWGAGEVEFGEIRPSPRGHSFGTSLEEAPTCFSIDSWH